MARYKQEDPDSELEALLTDGRDAATEVRLMRAGGPRRFRSRLISILEDPTAADNELVQLLRSDQIRNITVLLASPDDAPFLSRMDTEGASSWKIWRVRRQVRQLAEAFLKIAAMRRRPNSLMVAFHKEDLIWNIGIVGNRRVVVRPYDRGTGHDKRGSSLHLSGDQEESLALSFLNYFEAVARKPGTRWLSESDFPSDSPKWPSLFKGNAVRASSRDYDGTEEPALGDDEVCKICSDPESQRAEERWFGLRPGLRRKVDHFRPAEMRGRLLNLRGAGLRIQRISGPSLFDMLACLASICEHQPDRVESARALAANLLSDSYLALSDFRRIAPEVLPPEQPYPYATKLRRALVEVRPYLPVIAPTLWDAFEVDVMELGRELESEAGSPFRDGHLKNRLWRESIDLELLVKKLLEMSQAELQSAMIANVVDIDFETANSAVTDWDDPFHILFFEHSHLGLNPGMSTPLLLEVASSTKDNLLLWRTGLMRALLEHCRRLWYAKVMPETFRMRYQKETPGYFLKLAGFCAEKASGFLDIGRLLELLPSSLARDVDPCVIKEESDATFVLGPAISGRSLEPREFGAGIASTNPNPWIDNAVDAVNAKSVFICYSHKDRRLRDTLETHLKGLQREGVVSMWYDGKIVPGAEWDHEIKRHLEAAHVILLLISADFIASDYCWEKELPKALKRHKSGAAVVIPVLLRKCDWEKAPFAKLQGLPDGMKPVTTWKDRNAAWTDVAKGIRARLKAVK